MKRKLFYLLSTLVVLSMFLGACATPAAEAPKPTEPPKPTEAPEPTTAPEPTEAPAESAKPAEPTKAAPEDLDNAFSGMLDSMVAYNTINADMLLAEMAEDNPPFLLDVRTTAELEENGHIEGATHIPLEELAQHTDLLPSYDTPIVTYCGSGWRATIAMTALHALGWEGVRALKTTFADWVEAGNPVAEGLPENMALNAAEPDAGMLIAIDNKLAVYGVKPFGVIDAEGFNMALAESPDLVIDVRKTEEVEEMGSIDTGEIEQINIPLEAFIASKDMWPTEESEIVIYCGSGHRSTMAMSMLGSYGYDNVSSLKGGFSGWAEAGYPVSGGAVDAETVLGENYQVMLDNMTGYNAINADDLLAEMAEDAPPFLLDVRTTAELEENGHIEGATHIPLNELAQNTNLLPSFDTPIVAYCGSGWRATIAMTALQGMGWTNVRALKTTFADWVEAGNPVAEGVPENMQLDAVEVDPAMLVTFDVALANYGEKPFGVIDAEGFNTALAENSDLIVIDVRRAEELEEKGIVDTGEAEWVHIPLEDFIVKMEDWPADIDADIVIYCGSGHRSTMALEILGSYGYDNVSSLKGGFGGWAEGGFPVAEYTMTGDVGAVEDNLQTMLSTMEGYNTVKADDLMAELAEDQPPFLLDVRTTAELEENGHIEGATHVELNELAQHIDLLPSFNTPIVTYCGSGWRATIAMTALHAMGWTDVRALKTTYVDWVEAGNPVAEGVPEPMVLDVAQSDPAAISLVDAVLSTYGVKPFGVTTVEDLNGALVENPDIILMDVRRLEELEEKGVIDTGSKPPIHIPLEDLITNMADWPVDTDAPITVYCGSGHRSTMAMTILWLYGYNDVNSLKGGFGDWVEAGYPVAEFVAQ